MSQELFRIVYCSRIAGPTLASVMLPPILAVSRRNNARAGVSGALMSLDDRFAQVLEGPFEAVAETFERIQADERHEDVILLQAHVTGTRLFAGWAMGLASPNDPKAAHAALRAAIDQSAGDSASNLVKLLDALVRREHWVAALA